MSGDGWECPCSITWRGTYGTNDGDGYAKAEVTLVLESLILRRRVKLTLKQKKKEYGFYPLRTDWTIPAVHLAVLDNGHQDGHAKHRRRVVADERRQD